MSPGRRFTEHFLVDPESVTGLAAAHPAVTGARTLFPGTVMPAEQSPRLLVSGINQRKLGDRVAKGAWSGMPIYALTLEERATCPASCHHWRTCYGNGMPFARRHAAGPALEYLLATELRAKQQAHPAGFVIRLHVLDDFYDAAYVALWARWLAEFPALHAFGFTARDETSDEGILIRMLNRDHPSRFVIRFSTPAPKATPGVRYATTIWHMPQGPTEEGAVVCPAQTGRTECCGTCAFCWSGTKPVAFIAHGTLGRGTAQESQAPHEPAETDDIEPAHPHPVPLPLRQQPANAVRTPPPRAARASSPAPPPMLPVIEHPALDPTHAVPMRLIEIRAWLRQVDPAALDLSDAALLPTANRHRARLHLPPIRLIPPHEHAAGETLTPLHFSRVF